jgi:sec-independent protein translocase protein TatC
LRQREWFDIILLGLFGTCIIGLLGGSLFTNYLWKHILGVLLNFGSDQVDFITNMGAFLSFYRKTTIAFAISACLPWISFLFVKWDIFTYQQTVLLRRWWILVIFLIATIMSPPDVFSQIVIALPLWLFLEITWFILALMESEKNYNKKE